jgi:hypothetical protein
MIKNNIYALRPADLKNRSRDTVANCVSNGNAAHGSSTSVVEVMKAIEQIFPQALNFAAVK